MIIDLKSKKISNDQKLESVSGKTDSIKTEIAELQKVY